MFQYGFATESKVQELNIVPFGAWLSDLLENLDIVGMLSIYMSITLLPNIFIFGISPKYRGVGRIEGDMQL